MSSEPHYIGARVLMLLCVTLTSSTAHPHPSWEGDGHAHTSEHHSHTDHAPSCEHEDFYCDPHDPTVFHQCAEGITHDFNCPPSLHFNSIGGYCDWPHLSDCGGYQGGGGWGGHHGDGNHHHHDDGYLHHDDSDQNHHDDGNHHHDDGNYHHDDDDYHPHDDVNHHHHDDDDYHHNDDIANHHHDNNDDIRYDSYDDHMPEHHSNDPHSNGWSDDIKIHTWFDDEPSPWWRPRGLKESAWRDVRGVALPDHVVHIPKGAEKVKGHSRMSENVKWKDGECSSSNCHLPACRCPGTDTPHDMPRHSTPQMVMLTFDDEVSDRYMDYFMHLFRRGRNNPNGCQIRGCMFVAGSGTIYDHVKPLYDRGLEIASHTISHRFPTTWWSNASYHDYVEEASGMKALLVEQAAVPGDDVSGFRVPFLQLGADNMYRALYDGGFTYDSSMFMAPPSQDSVPSWPWTLDYVTSGQYCQAGPCPKMQYPGMWEIPVQRWYGLDGGSCAMPDGCSQAENAQETFEYLMKNFRRYYETNRAPMGMFLHAKWFLEDYNLEGLDMFMDYILSLGDVYMVTPLQVIEWMKRPTSLSDIHDLEAWQC